MRSTALGCGLVAALATFMSGCGDYSGDVPPDEALERVRYGGGEYADLGADSTAEEWVKAAYEYYRPAEEDYFEDMDAIGTTDGTGASKLELTPEAVMGRNAWVLWAGGNEAFWDWLARNSYGATDLLKLVDDRERGRRFATTGLITEPGTRPPTDGETKAALGVRYARPITEHSDPNKIHVEYREGREPAEYDVYGYPSGVVGLRLFKNPEFTEEAKSRWKADLYYSDTPEGRRYAAAPDTIRPFRVAMSCGYCHIAPHPLKPPADPEFPEWENLSNNIGNQYLRFRAAFANRLRPDNYLYHVLDSQLPGALDTSLIPSDNINNPNTINPFYGLRGRIERAGHNPKETISGDSLEYLRKYVDPNFENPHHVPRVLLDGSDSVGVHIALSRVYLNIGTHHQQWIRVHNPLFGFREQEPFKLRDIAENSLYWHATLIRIDPMAAFFKRATDPMRLKDAPLTNEQRSAHLKGNGLPWHPEYEAGRAVFARGCIACHSSIQPGDLPVLEEKIVVEGLPDDRTLLRLRWEEITRLTRGDGTLPADYEAWAREAVKHREFWEHTERQGDGTEVVVHNFLSTDRRIPVTVTHTNSARAAATNAIHGNIWEDFASQTFKELDAVGRIRYQDPFSGAVKSYETPSGGPGYYRVPPLISIWATAPFLHNNALGVFNNDPSVKGRLESFDDSIGRLLSPEKRGTPSKQWFWDIDQEPKTVYDAWYEGKRKQTPEATLSDTSSEEATERLAADGGWVWRTTEESWLMFDGHHLPTFVRGLTGWPALLLTLLPWLPSIVLVVLAVALLLSGPIISFREMLERKITWLEWVFGPLRWVIGVGGLALAGVAAYFVWDYWPAITVLDVATRESIPLLRTQVILLPVVLVGATGVLFSLHRLPAGGFRRLVSRSVGVFCLVLAILVALGFGRFLSGNGADVRFGPIPEGVPVNILANMDPKADPEDARAAREALIDFVLDYHEAEEGEKPGRKEFEERVAPALLNASKCPDFVTDRGHDYEFIRDLTDEEKEALIFLLKSF